jgi:hypothetical protein
MMYTTMLSMLYIFFRATYTMPYSIRKVRGKNCYSVKRRDRGKRRVMSKCTTKRNAKRQVALLYALEQPGFKLRPRKGRR